MPRPTAGKSQPAALGLLTRLADLTEEEPESAELSKTFWRACAGGQRRAAEYLLLRGADLNWVHYYAERTPRDAAKRLGTRQENVTTWLRRNRRPLGRFGIGRPPRSPDQSLGQLGHGTIRMVSNRPTYPMRSAT